MPPPIRKRTAATLQRDLETIARLRVALDSDLSLAPHLRSAVTADIQALTRSLTALKIDVAEKEIAAHREDTGEG